MAAHLASMILPSCASVASAAERNALVTFYEATDGANWRRSDNWLSDQPVGTWYGVGAGDSGHVINLFLELNGLSGTLPDLSAFTYLQELSLYGNRLTGSVPDLRALTNLTRLSLDFNQLSGPIPDLSQLTRLTVLDLNGNQLTGQIPDLSALTNLTWLTLGHNQLTGPIPELSLIATLEWLDLSHNQLTGPVLDLSTLTRLKYLDLGSNQLTGPVPEFSAHTNLAHLSLEGNQLCFPGDADFTGSNAVVTAHLESLNLPACPYAETMLTPGVPQNLTTTIEDDQVTLTWNSVSNAVSYELRAWDSIGRAWENVGDTLTGTSHTHTVLTDGRNYYYQVRALHANGVAGTWSERLSAAVVTQNYLPPPDSLGFDIFYQKYMDVGGVAVVAPSEVSDKKRSNRGRS